jgi:hypothetical protein
MIENERELDYARKKLLQLDEEKSNNLSTAITFLLGSLLFAVSMTCAILNKIVWAYWVSLVILVFTLSVCIIAFRSVGKISADYKKIERFINNYLKEEAKKLSNERMEKWYQFQEKLVDIRYEKLQVRNVYTNLKFRDEIISNACGKLTNKTLIENFFNEKIADENFDDGSVVPVTIKMAIDKFKNYDFALQVPYRTMLKRYEEKQELLDKYNKQEQKPRVKRKTNKKK